MIREVHRLRNVDGQSFTLARYKPLRHITFQLKERLAKVATLLSMKTKIVTPRLEETRRWYCDLFGMSVLEEWNDPDDCGCILGLGKTPGEALLEIHRRITVSDYTGMSLQFRVDDVDRFHVPQEERFRSQGPESRPWDSRYLSFKDPNGISVVVFSGTSL